jgi:shikimate kinase / 3-dehydroquinate synthase
VKARVVGEDEREQGVRASLNLGHTIGHALEAQYGFDKWTHGEAVSLGLVAALRLGVAKGLTSRALFERVVALLHRLGLPFQIEASDLVSAAGLVGHDKKRSGDAIRFVFVEEIGTVRFERLGIRELRDVIPSLAG